MAIDIAARKRSAQPDARGTRTAPPAVKETSCEAHRRLADQVRAIRSAADAAEEPSYRALLRSVDRAYDLLTHAFIPHAREEERLRARLAYRDYRCVEVDPGEIEVERLTERLAAAKARLARTGDVATLKELRGLLHELAALVALHFSDLEPHATHRTRAATART